MSGKICVGLKKHDFRENGDVHTPVSSGGFSTEKPVFDVNGVKNVKYVKNVKNPSF